MVGGGLAGLSLAIALRQRGVDPVIVERDDRSLTSGAGLYLIGAATRALGALGVRDAVEAGAAVSRSQSFFTHRGQRLAEVDAAGFWASCGPCLGIARATLHRILLEKAGLTIRYGTSPMALEHGRNAVTVTCSDGSKGEYALVVGADGIRSVVSRLALNSPAPRFRKQLGWRFIAPRPPQVNGWSVYLATGRAFLMLPISATHVYCYADRSAQAPVADPLEGRCERVRETFRDFAAPVGAVLDDLTTPNEIHYGAIEDVALPTWGVGRVLVIGDAAHAMSPNMACGAAMAFEDALVLAEIIAAHGFSPAVPQQFELRRRERVRWVREQTDRRDRLRELPTFARNLFLRFAVRRAYAANYRPLLTRE